MASRSELTFSSSGSFWLSYAAFVKAQSPCTAKRDDAPGCGCCSCGAVLAASVAWWASFAGVTNATWGRTVLPTFPSPQS